MIIIQQFEIDRKLFQKEIIDWFLCFLQFQYNSQIL